MIVLKGSLWLVSWGALVREFCEGHRRGGCLDKVMKEDDKLTWAIIYIFNLNIMYSCLPQIQEELIMKCPQVCWVSLLMVGWGEREGWFAVRIPPS